MFIAIDWLSKQKQKYSNYDDMTCYEKDSG